MERVQLSGRPAKFSVASVLSTYNLEVREKLRSLGLKPSDLADIDALFKESDLSGKSVRCQITAVFLIAGVTVSRLQRLYGHQTPQGVYADIKEVTKFYPILRIYLNKTYGRRSGPGRKPKLR